MALPTQTVSVHLQEALDTVMVFSRFDRLAEELGLSPKELLTHVEQTFGFGMGDLYREWIEVDE